MAIFRLALLALILATPSCSLFQGSMGFVEEAGPTMSEPELRERLLSFADTFSRTIQGAADDVSAGASDQASRKAILLWKMVVIEECRQAATLDDPRAAFADCWTLAVQLRRYFDDAADESSPQWMDERSRALALAASRKAEEDIREIGAAWLSSEDMGVVENEIEQYAIDNPIIGRFGRRSYERPSQGGREFPSMERVVKAPLSPFNVVGGIDRAAEAMHELSTVGGRFTGVVDQLPESARWEFQLAMYDLEARPTVVEVVDSMTDLAGSSRVIAQAADDFPADIQAALSSSLTEVGPAAEALRGTAEVFERTVTTTRDLATDLDGTLARAEGVVTAADRASGSFGRAGESWQGVFRAIEELKGPDEEPAPSPQGAEGAKDDNGFDVTEYGDAADRIGAAAVEIKAGIADLQAFLDGLDTSEVTDAVDTTTETTLNRTSEHAVRIVDHIARRAVQLLGVVFVLGLVFTFLVRRRG